MSQEALFDQPITMKDVDAYLEALHQAEEHEASIAADLKEAKEDTKECRRNLRKIRARVRLAATQEVAGSIVQRLDGTSWFDADGNKTTIRAGRSTSAPNT